MTARSSRDSDLSEAVGAMPTGSAEAAAYLRDLLTTPGRYRDVWLRHSQRRRDGLNQAAVAAVLSHHLWETGEASERDLLLARRLKDRVSRSLSGKVLAPRMLRMFVEAFGISDQESTVLWNLLLDGGSLTPVVAPGAPLAGPGRPRGSLKYRTLAVHDYHRVGADRLPIEHRTVQVIRATADLDTVEYRFDTDAAAVQVLRGGRAAELLPSGVTGLHAVDITLTQPLRAGETASLEHRTIFAYRSMPEPVMRRIVRDSATNVEIHVTFDAQAAPKRVDWCSWRADRLDTPPVSAQPVTLNRAGEVHRYVEALHGLGAGFRWQWE